MDLYSIASGSSGNCIYISSGNIRLLVDTGISKKRIENGLAGIGVACDQLDGILVTHEHSDHIQGLGVMSRKYGIPIYTTQGTWEGIQDCRSIGKVDLSLFRKIRPDESFYMEDLKITPFKTSHDANESVAFRFDDEARSTAIATDLGVFDDYIVENLKNLDALMLEANHDVKMLEVGRYPYPLKQRILGEYGHLSNEASGKLLCRILTPRMRKILLAHLSKENNLPLLANETVRLEVELGDTPFSGREIDLDVARREEPTPLIRL